MYLKSIEMQGFKSFANKMNLQFHEGITGIVGPNGSGKSNVADAVRWVLGEQSAKSLRGGNMQDVIFSGTETRKPLGYASVAITFDNTDHKLNIDFNEVTVTRRLYRSGESEYLLNGAACRLKDINELFYDTGIGKEGYSIIGQGQIDRILSGKPEERRELFDEAAGIVKFKRRKAATQKKLADEQQNLVRVTDILSELTRQLGPLERQSETARVYLKKKEELKLLDVNMFLMELERIREDLGKIDQRYEIASGELQETKEAFEQTKQEYDRLEKELETLDATIHEAQEQAGRNAVQKQQMEGQLELLKEQILALERNQEQFGQRAEAIRRDRETYRKEQASYREQQEELREQLETVSKDREEKEQQRAQLQRNIQEKEAIVEKSKGEIITLLNQSTEGEPTADLLIRTSNLKGTTVEGAVIPTLIDEIPMIAVMAAFADGTTVIRDAQELKVKESDRITVMVENLKRMGADIEGTDDGMIIHGGKPLHGATIDSHLDHRVAMSFAVAGTICDGPMEILHGDCVKISYPNFYQDLYSLGDK